MLIEVSRIACKHAIHSYQRGTSYAFIYQYKMNRQMSVNAVEFLAKYRGTSGGKLFALLGLAPQVLKNS